MIFTVGASIARPIFRISIKTADFRRQPLRIVCFTLFSCNFRIKYIVRTFQKAFMQECIVEIDKYCIIFLCNPTNLRKFANFFHKPIDNQIIIVYNISRTKIHQVFISSNSFAVKSEIRGNIFVCNGEICRYLANRNLFIIYALKPLHFHNKYSII